MADELESQRNALDEADVEGHKHHPRNDDTDPDEAKLKLANDEDDDDVEAHKHHPKHHP